jgi:hypothetical protein
MAQTGQQQQLGQEQQIHFRHGHTDTHVLVQFSMPIGHVLFTPAETEAFIAALRNSQAKLAEHQATLVQKAS